MFVCTLTLLTAPGSEGTRSGGSGASRGAVVRGTTALGVFLTLKGNLVLAELVAVHPTVCTQANKEHNGSKPHSVCIVALSIAGTIACKIKGAN